MKTIQVEDITKNIREMCIEANHFLTEDMKAAMEQACKEEKSPVGQSADRRAGYDPHLSGYGNGSDLYGDRTGCAF